MNIHHLELFYYVAKHGGIMPAVHNIPYGIQQPAVSSQMTQLEEFLGVPLFHRRPFALTPAGQELYDFIKPFFDNLDRVADKIRGGVSQHLRIAASETVLREYLPGMLQELRRLFPKLKITLREGYHPEVIAWLQQQEMDVSLGLIGPKPPAGIQSLPLFKLPLVLLVPKKSKLKSARELLQSDPIEAIAHHGAEQRIHQPHIPGGSGQARSGMVQPDRSQLGRTRADLRRQRLRDWGDCWRAKHETSSAGARAAPRWI